MKFQFRKFIQIIVAWDENENFYDEMSLVLLIYNSIS